MDGHVGRVRGAGHHAVSSAGGIPSPPCPRPPPPHGGALSSSSSAAVARAVASRRLPQCGPPLALRHTPRAARADEATQPPSGRLVIFQGMTARAPAPPRRSLPVAGRSAGSRAVGGPDRPARTTVSPPPPAAAVTAAAVMAVAVPTAVATVAAAAAADGGGDRRRRPG